MNISRNKSWSKEELLLRTLLTISTQAHTRKINCLTLNKQTIITRKCWFQVLFLQPFIYLIRLLRVQRGLRWMTWCLRRVIRPLMEISRWSMQLPCSMMKLKAPIMIIVLWLLALTSIHSVKRDTAALRSTTRAHMEMASRSCCTIWMNLLTMNHREELGLMLSKTRYKPQANPFWDRKSVV